jgi:quercetin dioxygenase-like cupin family protein
MKRHKFITSLLAATALPLISFPRARKVFPRMDKGFKVNAGEGRIHGHMQLKGVNSNVLDLKVSGSDTDGGMAIFEQTSLSQGKGTPLHVHPLQDEVFYVLEGDYRFMVGEEKFSLTAGDSIFMPRNVPHAWTQVSEKGKMNVIFQPAGKMENFFISVAALNHEPTHAEMAQLFLDNEMKIIGPPLKIE